MQESSKNISLGLGVAATLVVSIGAAGIHAFLTDQLPFHWLFAGYAGACSALLTICYGLSPMLTRDRGSNKEPASSMEATERVLTIMFIDIVGFSRMAERQKPKEAFSSLKGLLNSLRKQVVEHGGYVDRTLGDGMLCVFGGGHDQSGDNARNHARDALACAASIQRTNIRRILKAQETGQAVFPVRIGINTAGVFIGNLGNREKADVTVIGNGVNLASRLESACDRHMVMIGSSTRDLLATHNDAEGIMRRRYVRIKHHTELVEAYEYDPFYGNEQLLQDGDEAYRIFIGAERGETRWPVPMTTGIRIHSDLGDGDLINFSDNGFTVKLPNYYANGVVVIMTLDSEDGDLGQKFADLGLEQIMVEVRWARPSQAEGYVHGCMIKNLSPEQCAGVVQLLRERLQLEAAETPLLSA